jgi:hypothetical protein
MAKIQDKFISRHIVEIRFKNRNFAFIDSKGKMLNSMIKSFDWDKVHISDSKIQIANEDESKIVFASWENFGFQIESSTSFEELRIFINEFFSNFKLFHDYDFENLSRIGTKSVIFNHRTTKSNESVNQIFKDKFFKNNELLEGTINGKITDSGVYALDLDFDERKANLNIGPMTKDEVIRKIYKNPRYSKFQYDSGLFLNLDIFSTEFEISSDADLKKYLLENISYLETKLKSILKYFFE